MAERALRKSGSVARVLGAGAALAVATAAVLAINHFGMEFMISRPDRQPALTGAPDARPPSSNTFKLSFAGQPRAVPDLHFVDGEGHSLSLAAFRGRALLLNIWATWCVPCRKEMPTLDRLQAKLGSTDFQVVALSIDRQGAAVIKPFYQELGLRSLGIYVDPSGKAAGDLKAPGVPVTLLVDREGREIARKLGPAEWDSPEMIGLIRRHLGLPASERKASR
jgi:thiol-disulfide isomerase/thioredoxin